MVYNVEMGLKKSDNSELFTRKYVNTDNVKDVISEYENMKKELLSEADSAKPDFTFKFTRVS